MIKRIYIDTSVFGGYFDKEFEKETKHFFERILEKQIMIIVSEILELELYRAPNYIQDFFEALPDNLIERVELNNEARELSEKYISEKVVGKTSRADCQHIALATINKADVLASWNFKHIVNLERIRGYNSINFREGYGSNDIVVGE
jgi:predicted nucleic acid-binding protein